MVKPLLLVPLVANLFVFVLSTATQSSSKSVACSSSASSSSKSITSTGGPPPNTPCGPSQVPFCRVNEIWSNCPIAVCVPKTCQDVGFPVACVDLRPDGYCPVKPGCICREGFVRNYEGICIPMKHCPSCGGDRNAESGCGTNCNRLCSNYNKKPGACAQGCLYNSCECRQGFVFDEIKRKCVFPSQCTRMNCTKKNEVYDSCPAPCPFHTCGINDAAISCMPAPYPGDPNCAPPKCRCRDGYYRNDVGECVLWENCPVCRGLNEIYDPCPATCPPQECGVNIAVILCLVPPELGDPECEPGCRCIDDYVRDYTGVCIPRDQCPTCPNPNEVYDPCIAPCPPRRCDVDERLIKCAAPPKLGDPLCEAGCRCADGYYRNSLGVCVTKAECPSCDGPYEHYACGGACDNVCATLQEQNQTHCPIINIRCNDMCYCDEGYARDDNNICIPIEKCNEPKCMGKHEVYSDCIQGDCRPKNCSQLGFPVPCPSIDPKFCEKGCLCSEGYVRDKYGECIPTDQCPSCGGDSNSKAGCGVNCNKHCSDIGKEPGFCITICYENACDCKDGFYYDDNTNKCVLPKDCTPTCGTNEVYSDCVQGNCSPQNCTQLGFPIACPRIDPKYCKKGCLCIEGYVRNEKGVCIPVKQCPSCGGHPHAESGCGKNCGRLCSNYFKEGVVCTLECQINGCDCREGYVYDTNTNQCVLPKGCTPICKKDEVYSECINGGCSPKNCSQIGLPIPCVKLNPKACIKGCLCQEGYLREDNGVCVPINECNNQCNKLNEYYEPCDYDCPPQTCESLDRAYACPIREDETCKSQCKCKEGYYRNKIGECITEKQCRQCMGPYEYFSCGGACDNVCATLQIQNQTNCPIINIKCNEMCYCEKDYARAKNGTCIPIKKCHKPQCGKNERYEKCPAWLCEPQKCGELGYPIPCPDIPAGGKCPVKPACVCVDGYVKDDKGKCIPKEECPSCGGDRHAQSGCGVNCGKKCEDLGKEPGPCIDICFFNACDCRDGYYYDNEKKKCVLPSKCTGICSGENEIFENCTNPSCRPTSCSQLGFPLNCTDPPKCNKGCVCKEGYVRNAKGICIPINQCPSCGGDENAESGCGVNCGKKCEDLGKKPGACIEICFFNACDCRDGYYYDNEKKKCVLPSKCTGICSGKNEIFENCTNPSCRSTSCSQLGFPLNCTDPPKCNKGCVCKEGYVRNAKGICIPIKQCPSCGGDENAESGCGVNCGKKCYDLQNPNKPRPCPRICRVNSCDCKKGFYYDDDAKKCVPPKKCKPTCCEDEVYDACVNGGCGYRNCSQINGPIICIDPIKCKGGCTCKEGYLRLDDTGVCVPVDKCPKICDEPNEEYVECPPTCPPQTCESINKTYFCPLIKKKINKTDCVGECRCIEGYYRNLIGECITKDDCSKCTGNHEYFSCGSACDNVCCDLDTQSKDNCPIRNKKCVERCYCEDGYARDDNGVCVCIDECPGRGTTTPKPTVNSTVALANFEQGNTKLAVEFLYNLLDSRPGQNFMFSAFSVLIVLAQLALSAFGVSLEQLLRLLNLNDKEEISTVFPIIIGNLKDQQDVTLELANLIVGNIGFPFTEQFKRNAEYFNSEVDNTDFSKNIEAAAFINAWVKNHTNGLITDLVSADMFNALTRVAFFNCMYFLGNWEHQFNPDDTQPRDFYLNDNETVSLPTMFQQNTFKYAESDELDGQILLVPYKGAQFNLLIFLPRKTTQAPNTQDRLKSLVKKLQDPDIFAKSMDCLTYEKVQFYMPRMDFPTNIPNLKDLLIQSNLTAPLEPNSHDFRGIFENDIPLYITDAVQKSVFKANEKGTEAAVATGIIVGTTAVQFPTPQIYTFDWNRPGAFFLLYGKTVLLSGVYAGAQ